jgi:hypothetical protein
MMFKLVRQRDFVADPGSTKQIVKVESPKQLPKLGPQTNQKLGVGTAGQFRRVVHVRPRPAIRSFRGRD